MFDFHADARVVGSVLRWWRRSPWGRAIAALGFVVGLTLLVEAMRHSWQWSWPSWESVGMAIVVLLLVGFLWAAATTQRRIVISSFEDHVHEEPSRAVAGIPALLRQEMARLRVLYGPPPSQRLAVDVSQSSPGTDLDVAGSDLSQDVQAVVTADTKLNVGVVGIPLAPALGFLARFLRGPRLMGSVHRDGDDLVLAAELHRRSGVQTWSVRASSENDDPATIAALARRLASRVVGLVVHGPTIGPEVLDAYHAGLNHYSDAVRNPATKQNSLRSARNALRDAAGRDPSFAWAAFNLGLVYQELGSVERPEANLLAAEQCFDRACNADARKWEFRHARCVVARDREDLDGGLTHGREAERLAQGALPRAKSAYQVGFLLGSGEQSAQRSVLVQRRRSASSACRAVVISTLLEREDRSDADRTAALTLLNLGVACAYTAKAAEGFERRRWRGLARRALALAAKLRPADAALPLELAGIESKLGSARRAVAAARTSAALDSSELRAWVIAAVNHARRGEAYETRRCVSALVRSPCRALVDNGPLCDLLEQWRDLEDREHPPWLEPVEDYLERVINVWDGLQDATTAELTNRVESGNQNAAPAGWPDLSNWELAMAHVRLAHEDRRPHSVDDDQTWRDMKVGHLLDAVNLLRPSSDGGDPLVPDHSEEIRYLGLRSAIAGVLLQSTASNFTYVFDARSEALTAVREEPFDAAAHDQLAQAQRMLMYFAGAESAIKAALDSLASGSIPRWPAKSPLLEVPMTQSQTRYDLQRMLAGVLRERADTEHGDARRASLSQAERILRGVSEDVSVPGERWAAYFELGLTLRNQRRYAQALEAFRVAYQAGEESEVCALLAAESAIEAERFADGEEWLGWLDLAVRQKLDMAVREGLDEVEQLSIQLGGEADFAISLADMLVFGCWLRGRTLLDREPAEALRLARAGLNVSTQTRAALADCDWLAGRARLRLAARASTLDARRKHLTAAVAAHEQGAMRSSSSEDWLSVVEALVELAAVTAGDKVEELRQRAEEYLGRSERLDADRLYQDRRGELQSRLRMVPSKAKATATSAQQHPDGRQRSATKRRKASVKSKAGTRTK